jgi:lysozyme
VYCKATQGATYKDPNFNEYWQYLKTTTLLRGAYIFWDCRYTAQQHWDNLASLGIDFSKPNVLPLCLDIENQMKPELDTWVIHNSAECIQSITDLLELIKINTGRKPMMYTYSNYLKEYLAGHSWQDCYLWLADYDGVAPKQHWDLWQTSQYGTTSGKLSGGNLDIDYFNGTIEELAKL